MNKDLHLHWDFWHHLGGILAAATSSFGDPDKRHSDNNDLLGTNNLMLLIIHLLWTGVHLHMYAWRKLFNSWTVLGLAS